MSSHTNGAAQPGSGTAADPNFLLNVTEALKVVHAPQSSNEARKEASYYLENSKRDPEAPDHGFTLASDTSQPAVVRHYALSLLEHAINHNWEQYSDDQATTLRNWVVQLGQNISSSELVYVRNKIAQLWVEIAKRSWGTEWIEMDEQLVQLWSGSLVSKELVMAILESLSDDVFNGEDTVAALRYSQLRKACVDIFTPASVLAQYFPGRETTVDVRCGVEGWLARLGSFLTSCIQGDVEGNTQVMDCTVKALAALRSAISWCHPKAIISAQCADHISGSLAAPIVTIRMASIDALNVLYARSLRSEEVLELVCPMFRPGPITLMRQLYQWSLVDVSDIDEEQYKFMQKFSEMVSRLAGYLEDRPNVFPPECSIPEFLELLLSIAQNPSLLVSIPILKNWTKLLRSGSFVESPGVSPLIGPLLELCSQRLISYDQFPKDSEDVSYLFLNEDIELVQDQQIIVANYRRCCIAIVEQVVRRKPFEAMYHILGQVDQFLKSMHDGQPPFRPETFTKHSMLYLRVDAHFTTVEAALNGYMAWKGSYGTRPQEAEHEHKTMEDNLESWCEYVLGLEFQDPYIKKRVLSSCVILSTTILGNNTSSMLKVLEKLLVTGQLSIRIDEYPIYKQAMKDLQSACVEELQSLAQRMPDHLMSVYDQLEKKVNEIVAANVLEKRLTISYFTFLFIITLRTTLIDEDTRRQRMEGFLAPVMQAWESQDFEQQLSTREGFQSMFGIDKVQQYLIGHNINEIADWSLYPLDDDAKALQEFLDNQPFSLPLRPTRLLLKYSIDKVKAESKQYEISSVFWADRIPRMLPPLLRLLSYSQKCMDTSTWDLLPPEVQPVVPRILRDRFWQIGISAGTKEDFYEKVHGTKATLEGLASSIRAVLRNARELSYDIIQIMTRFGSHFYGLEALPTPLAHALFDDALALSSHHFTTLLKTVKAIIDDCPPQLRGTFLSPILAQLFSQLDKKMTAEWDAVTQGNQGSTQNDNLGEEMKFESILRQLTWHAAGLVSSALEHPRDNPAPKPDPEHQESTTYETVGVMILGDLAVLEPLVLLCMHMLRMPDTRSCGVIGRCLRNMVPNFCSQTQTHSAIREFIAKDVLQAAITSLNDPNFVDNQLSLAHLIAVIYMAYRPLTETPKQVLLSLPGVTEERLAQMEAKLLPNANAKLQRALILNLLQGLRGVSISESGKVAVSGVRKGGRLSAMQEEFVKDNREPGERARGDSRPSLDLTGVADMFS